jgi:hypothetical protein
LGGKSNHSPAKKEHHPLVGMMLEVNIRSCLESSNVLDANIRDSFGKPIK